MKHTRTTLTALATAMALGMLPSAPAFAQDRDDQGDAREQMRAGNQLSLRQIEKRVVARMRGAEYIPGPIYVKSKRIYRFKFVKNSRVIHVDVDARTGRIISQTR